MSPSQCDADINQARLTCCLTYCSRWHAYLRGGAAFFFFFFLSASLISEIATSLSCSFHLPGWQLTVLWLSRSPLLWLITSQTSHCTGISAGPHTVPSEKFNRKPARITNIAFIFQTRAKTLFEERFTALKKPYQIITLLNFRFCSWLRKYTTGLSKQWPPVIDYWCRVFLLICSRSTLDVFIFQKEEPAQSAHILLFIC